MDLEPKIPHGLTTHEKDHAPSDAQKNSDITKTEIETVLTGEISSHTHSGGSGDMTKAVYDPTSVEDDVFDMANMVEATNAKVMTGTERIKLAGLNFDGLNKISVGTDQPTDPEVGDLWIDTN